MARRLKLVFFLISIILSNNVFGNGMRFTNIDVDSGLSSGAVLSICQDKDGILWIATTDGLNRYDSYKIETFHHNVEDTESIASDVLLKLFPDSMGNLWIGTDMGVSLYKKEGTFLNFYPRESVSGVLDITDYSEKFLLLAYRDGLFLMDKESGCVKDDMLPVQTKTLAQCCLLKKENGDLLIGTSEGEIFTWDMAGGDLRKVPGFRAKSKINALIQNNTELWIGTEGDGLYCLNEGTISHFNKKSLCSDYIRSLAFDNFGRLWIGTYEGLNLYDNGQIKSYYNELFDKRSLSQNSVRCLYADTQGGMWLGTYFGGLNYWHPYKNRFNIIRPSTKYPDLTSSIFSCIVKDTDGTVWLGANNSGVEHLDLKTGRSQKIEINASSKDYGSNDVKAILVEKNAVYVGAQSGGFSRINKANGSVKHFSNAPNDIYSIINNSSGEELLIGALSGLYIYNKATETTYKHPSGYKHRIQTLLRLESGELWIGGEALDVIDIHGNIITPELLKRIKSVLCFHRTDSGIMYIASREGLFVYNAATMGLTQLTTNNGLPDNTIQSIEEDQYGILWLGTGRGLVSYNPYTESIRTFSLHDGLPSMGFNAYSHCQLENGRILFGTLKGIVDFNPKDLKENQVSPAPFVSRFTLIDKEIYPKPGDEIILESKYKGITAEFAVTNYISSSQNTFAYKLWPVEKEWNYSTNNNIVRFANLKHGNYSLLLKSANNDGIWNETVREYKIRIKPSLTQTLAFKLSIIFLILIGGAVFLRMLADKRRISGKIEIDQKEMKHQEEMHQMKIKFFVNLLHELKTPITLITAPIQEMISNTDSPWMQKQLTLVNNNAQRLTHIVNQMLDFRRAELGVFKLQASYSNVSQTAKEICLCYRKFAESKNLNLVFSSKIEDQKLLCDLQYLELILNNLLSNAFKFTSEGDISVELEKKNNDLLITVADTGCGISEEQSAHIFDRFYTTNNEQHVGCGIGLSLVRILAEKHHGEVNLISTEGKGSSFMVSIPQNPELYSGDELSSEAKSISLQDYKSLYLDEVTPDNVQDAVNKRGRILVVDDDSLMRQYLNEVLSKNYDVFLASEGKEALEVTKNNDIDLILSDIQMPGMDGFKLCSEIKSNIKTSHIPVIVISSREEKKDLMTALQVGSDDYIVKPFDIHVLVTKIKNILLTRQRLMNHVSDTGITSPEDLATNPLDEKFLKKAFSIVNNNLANPDFSTVEFAKAMAMSRSSFHLKIKAITGETPLDFIKRIRFAQAIELMKKGDVSMAQIAELTGFNSLSYFSTSFKKYFGCVPTEYVSNINGANVSSK